MNMDIVCWLAFPCHYYTGIFRELAHLWQGKITAVFEHKTNSMYKGLNLQSPELGKINSIYLDQTNDSSSLARDIITANANAIHIYLSFQPREKFFQLCIPQIIKTTDTKLVIFSERPRQYTFFMGLARELNYRLNALKYRSKVSAILALGNLGAAAFNRFGFNETKIFPMLYCVDQSITQPITQPALQPITITQQTISSRQIKSEQEPIRFIHLAGLQEHYRKGLDLIFKAFSSLQNLNWTCDILGFDRTVQLSDQIRSMGLEQKIHFLGKCTNTEVFEYIQKNDILLLPSRHDGWGVAIAEAIFCGLGTIASDNVGSKDLIEGFQCGQILKAGDVRSLANSIKFCIENKFIVEQWKSNAIKHRHRLTSLIVADYMKQILEYVFINKFQGERPVPPWNVNAE
ncbi:MAG: glycosyltransferase [Planctomycetaceae bacterium]|jgi:glycosyltransferase involved in cell wall biosynthesis|nr:glycosyltransferase [Planctomycetaceae bacterium]